MESRQHSDTPMSTLHFTESKIGSSAQDHTRATTTCGVTASDCCVDSSNSSIDTSNDQHAIIATCHRMHSTSRQVTPSSSGIACSTHQEKDAIIAAFIDQLISMTQAAQENVSAFQALQTEMVVLQRTTNDLSNENEELVNDMQDAIHENQELKARHDVLLVEKLTLHAKCAELRNENDLLEENDEMLREESLDPDEIADLVGEIREQMKRKLKGNEREKSNLEEECQRLSREKQELRDELTRIAGENICLQEKLRETSAVAAELRRETGRIGAQKHSLETKLRLGSMIENEGCSCDPSHQDGYYEDQQRSLDVSSKEVQCGVVNSSSAGCGAGAGKKNPARKRRSIKDVFTSWKQQSSAQEHAGSDIPARPKIPRRQTSARAARVSRSKSCTGIDVLSLGGSSLGKAANKASNVFACQILSDDESDIDNSWSCSLRGRSSYADGMPLPRAQRSPQKKPCPQPLEQPMDEDTKSLSAAPLRRMSKQMSWFSVVSAASVSVASDADTSLTNSWMTSVDHTASIHHRQQGHEGIGEGRRSMLERESSNISIDSVGMGDDCETLLVDFGPNGPRICGDVDDENGSNT